MTCMRQPLLFYQSIFSITYTGYCSWPRLCGCGGYVPGIRLAPSQPAPGRRSGEIDADHLLWSIRRGNTDRRWDCAAPEGIGILPRPGEAAHIHTAAGFTAHPREWGRSGNLYNGHLQSLGTKKGGIPYWNTARIRIL